MLTQVIMKGMIKEFIVIISSISLYIERKIRRSSFVIYILWVILKTSITSPLNRLYFRVGKFK